MGEGQVHKHRLSEISDLPHPRNPRSTLHILLSTPYLLHPEPDACLQVRAVANTAMEREERALHLIERDVTDREARVASREKMLAEREVKV